MDLGVSGVLTLPRYTSMYMVRYTYACYGPWNIVYIYSHSMYD